MSCIDSRIKERKFGTGHGRRPCAKSKDLEGVLQWSTHISYFNSFIAHTSIPFKNNVSQMTLYLHKIRPLIFS
jgi:hypothetical protein